MMNDIVQEIISLFDLYSLSEFCCTCKKNYEIGKLKYDQRIKAARKGETLYLPDHFRLFIYTNVVLYLDRYTIPISNHYGESMVIYAVKNNNQQIYDYFVSSNYNFVYIISKCEIASLIIKYKASNLLESWYPKYGINFYKEIENITDEDFFKRFFDSILYSLHSCETVALYIARNELIETVFEKFYEWFQRRFSDIDSIDKLVNNIHISSLERLLCKMSIETIEQIEEISSRERMYVFMDYIATKTNIDIHKPIICSIISLGACILYFPINSNTKCKLYNVFKDIYDAHLYLVSFGLSSVVSVKSIFSLKSEEIKKLDFSSKAKYICYKYKETIKDVFFNKKKIR